MSIIGGRNGTPAVLYVNGQEVGYVSDWQFEVTTEQVQGSDLWGAGHIPGRQSAVIRLSDIDLSTCLPVPAPRGDIVTHLGARCCCRHCPDGGDHA